MGLRLLAAVVVAAVLAGPAAATPGTKLTVTYWAHGRTNPAKTWTLGCAPASGTQPKPALACAALRLHPDDLRPATRACTLMSPYNAPVARIRGAWRGQAVDRTYRIGCPGWNDLRVVLTGV